MNAEVDRQAVVSYLLTQLANRLNGAVDFWTIVCLSPALNPTAFLNNNGNQLRALVTVIGAELRMDADATAKGALEAWETVRSDCEDWLRLFFALENFRGLSPDQIVAHCGELKRLYTHLENAIVAIRRSILQPIDEGPPGGRGRTLKILDTLPDTFLAALSTEPATAAP